MNSPLVSIIIPVYNSAKYLAETIQTVIDQTWSNKELIIVDDGSTDSSLTIAQQFNYPWIKIHTQKNNGAPTARNLGIKYASGDFIQFLDADDLLSPNKIELQVKALSENPHKVAVCSTVHFNDGEDHLTNQPSDYEERFLFNTDDPSAFLVNLWGGNDNQGSMIQTNAWLTPIAIVQQAGPWEEFYSPDDDGEYFTRILLTSKGVVNVNGCYNYYRKAQKSLANRNNYKALFGCYKSTLLKRENLFKHTQSDMAKFAIARLLISLAIESYPKYASLSKAISKNVKELGNYAYTPISGGPFTRKLSHVLGWKIGRLLQYLNHKS